MAATRHSAPHCPPTDLSPLSLGPGGASKATPLGRRGQRGSEAHAGQPWGPLPHSSLAPRRVCTMAAVTGRLEQGLWELQRVAAIKGKRAAGDALTPK